MLFDNTTVDASCQKKITLCCEVRSFFYPQVKQSYWTIRTAGAGVGPGPPFWALMTASQRGDMWALQAPVAPPHHTTPHPGVQQISAL